MAQIPNHKRRSTLMPANFRGIEPKAKRPLLLAAPIKNVQMATFIVSKGLYSKAYINGLLARTNFSAPKAFDAANVQMYALKAKFND